MDNWLESESPIEGVGIDVVLIILGQLIFLILLGFFLKCWNALNPRVGRTRIHNQRQCPLCLHTPSLFSRPNPGYIIDVRDDNPPPVFNPGQCPVCLNPPALGVETNCGHLHCGSCFIRYHRLQVQPRIRGPVLCPLCRQRISLLFVCFTRYEVSVNDNIDEVRRISLFVNEYNRRTSHFVTLFEMVRDVPVLLRHFLPELLFSRSLRVRVRFFVLFLLTVFYISYPYDIIPEVVYGIFGFADDIIICVFFFLYCAFSYRHFLINLQ